MLRLRRRGLGRPRRVRDLARQHGVVGTRGGGRRGLNVVGRKATLRSFRLHELAERSHGWRLLGTNDSRRRRDRKVVSRDRLGIARKWARNSGRPSTTVGCACGLLLLGQGLHQRGRLSKLRGCHLARAGIRQIHVLGDFGFLSNGNPYERERIRQLNNALLARDQYMFVTGGNHEGYPTLYKWRQPDKYGYRCFERRIIWLPRRWRGRTAAGTVIASLGGANSISRDSRESIGGHIGQWHAEEQITEEDLSALGTETVDVLLGHDAPITAALDRHIAKNRHFWTKKGSAYARAGQVMFHRGVEQVRPKLVVSGHYHRHVDTTALLRPAGQEPFELRSVILDRNRTARSVAILELDSLTLEVPDELSPGLRRERDATTRRKRRRR